MRWGYGLIGTALSLGSVLGSTTRLDLACTPEPVRGLQGRLLFQGEPARGGLDKSWTKSLASPQNHCNNYVVID